METKHRVDPLEGAVGLLSGRWKLLILRELVGGPRRFGELRRALTGISQKVLTETLRDLEEQGLVLRTVYEETILRVTYSLTPAGYKFVPVLQAMSKGYGEMAGKLPAADRKYYAPTPQEASVPVEERLALIRRAVAHLPNVTVDSWDGLTVAYARKIGADCLVRGLRGAGDFQSESLLAQVNGRLAPGLETVFLLSKPEHMCVSSSVVREAASFGADISTFVPAAILADVEQHFRQGAG